MPTRHRSIKKVRKDRLKGFMDRRLTRAIGHPVREHILAVLNERVASPTEIGDEIELDVSAFYKHVQMLEELGCIECVERRQVRGASERFFRASSTLSFDRAAWAKLPLTLRTDLCGGLLKAIFGEAVAALKRGSLGGGEAEHLSWTPATVDARGQREVADILDETLVRLLGAQRNSTARMKGTGEEGIPVTFALLGFEADRASR
jgi:DNA-binding transcriptional ArsR family regulator